MLSEPLTTINS